MTPFPTPISPTPSTPTTITQLKSNLSSRLSYALTAFSCQIWSVFNTLTKELGEHVSVATAQLLRNHKKELRIRFQSLIQVINRSMDTVTAYVSEKG